LVFFGILHRREAEALRTELIMLVVDPSVIPESPSEAVK
jgi:hypothetical protein